MAEHSKLRLKSSCITRFVLGSRFLKILKKFCVVAPIHLNIQHTLYAHFSQCNTVNKEKDLAKTCQSCILQKFRSGIPYERSRVGRTTLAILQQIFTQKAM